MLYSIPKKKIYSIDRIKEQTVKKYFLDSPDKVEIEKIKQTVNLYGDFIIDTIYKEIGGHKGLIPVGASYQAQWVLVDTEGYFEFLGKKFRVDPQEKKYQVFNKKQIDQNGIENQWTNTAKMDRILGIYVNEQYYFLDEDIEFVRVSEVET